MKNLLSKLIQDFAKANKISSVAEFSRRYKIPRETARTLWYGLAAPRKIEHRQLLNKLIPHPIFEGCLTRQNKLLAMSSVLDVSPFNENGGRLILLLQALRPDLRKIVLDADKDLRDSVRNKIPNFGELITLMRAFSSEEALGLLQKEGSLADPSKGGEHGKN